MAYLLPSYLQKRILRYALSRLDLLDADQLNLDNLDIAWGKRSVIELRDVGVQLKVAYRSSKTEDSTNQLGSTEASRPLSIAAPIHSHQSKHQVAADHCPRRPIQ